MSDKVLITREDLREARRIVSRCFPYFPLPQKFDPRPNGDGPARWVFELIPEIAKALAMRSHGKVRR